MSMFISKALRRAEVFLEQVDESVAQASRRLVVEGATGGVDEHEDVVSSDEDPGPRRRVSSIPRAEYRGAREENNNAQDNVEESESMFIGDGWRDEVQPDDEEITDLTPLPPQDPNAQKSDTIPVNVETPTKQNVAIPRAASGDVLEMSDTGHQKLQLEVEADDMASPADHMKTTNEHRSVAPPPQAVEVVPEPDSDYVEALKTENSELRNELELVDTDLDKTRREKTKMVKNLKRMKEIVSEMDESLRDKSAEARSLEAELVTAKDEIAALRTKTRESDARGKDGIDLLRKELQGEIDGLGQKVVSISAENASLKDENERLKEALLHGNEVDMATADGAREEASQAHRAYEAETLAHRETRKLAKEREDSLETEAALATNALAAAQRKMEESIVTANNAKAVQRTTETKLSTVTSARDAAFARIEDLEETVHLFKRNEGNEAPGQREAKEMNQTISDLENALEAKNVELNRLEGEVESLRVSLRSRRDITSPRTAGQAGRLDGGNHQEVEVKLRHMADAALRKQSQLEVLRSENRALQHQLTTERKRTREAQAMAAAASSSRPTIRGGFRGILDSGDDDRGDRTYGVREGPLARFRTPRNWPRAMSKTISGIDRFSAQALAFLRKEPLLRIVIIIYLIGMHIFVYSLLHWHVEAVSGTGAIPHGSVASMGRGARIA